MPAQMRREPESGNTDTALLVRDPPRRARPFATIDAFIYAVFANSIVVAAALTYSLCWPWPDANIPLGIVLICLAFFPAFTVYAMLTTLMPRRGGDYAWQTRTLGGFAGYVLVFTPLLIGPWFYMASNVAPGSSMVAGALFVALGNLLDSRELVDFSHVFATRTGTWWFYVFYVTFAAMVVAAGMRAYASIQRVLFAAGMLVLFVWIAMLAVLPPGGFAAGFDAFMAEAMHFTGESAYQRILDLARDKGFSAVPLSETTLSSSLLIGPVLAYTFMYVAWTGTMAGEIRGTRRLGNSMFIYLGANLFSMLLCAGFVWLIIDRAGNPFFTSANFLWATNSYQDLPTAPHYGLFLMSLGRDPWYWLLASLGLCAWFFIWPTNNMVMSTRVMLAMSEDQVLPGFIGRFSARLGTPLAAVSICYLGSLLLGWLYFYTGFSTLTLDMPLMTAIAFAASTLAGTLLPYLPATRSLYRQSRVARLHLFGLPLITVMGVFGLAYFAVLFTLYVTDARYGTNNPLSALFILCSLAASAVVYLAYRRRQKKRSISLDLALRDIPPGTEPRSGPDG